MRLYMRISIMRVSGFASIILTLFNNTFYGTHSLQPWERHAHITNFLQYFATMSAANANFFIQYPIAAVPATWIQLATLSSVLDCVEGRACIVGFDPDKLQEILKLLPQVFQLQLLCVRWRWWIIIPFEWPICRMIHSRTTGSCWLGWPSPLLHQDEPRISNARRRSFGLSHDLVLACLWRGLYVFSQTYLIIAFDRKYLRIW